MNDTESTARRPMACRCGSCGVPVVARAGSAPRDLFLCTRCSVFAMLDPRYLDLAHDANDRGMTVAEVAEAAGFRPR